MLRGNLKPRILLSFVVFRIRLRWENMRRNESIWSIKPKPSHFISVTARGKEYYSDQSISPKIWFNKGLWQPDGRSIIVYVLYYSKWVKCKRKFGTSSGWDVQYMAQYIAMSKDTSRHKVTRSVSWRQLMLLLLLFKTFNFSPFDCSFMLLST